MTTPFRLALALLPLLLTACWTGKPFYAAHEVRAPIPTGHYEADTQSSSDPGQFHVLVRPDGYTSFAEPDGDVRIAGFAPLPDTEELFVAWFWEAEENGDKTLWYALLQQRGSDYFLSSPVCEETRSLAESVGAVFHSDPKVAICDFPDRASLESGLKRLAVEGPMRTIRLVPAEKGGASD